MELLVSMANINPFHIEEDTQTLNPSQIEEDTQTHTNCTEDTTPTREAAGGNYAAANQSSSDTSDVSKRVPRSSNRYEWREQLGSPQAEQQDAPLL